MGALWGGGFVRIHSFNRFWLQGAYPCPGISTSFLNWGVLGEGTGRFIHLFHRFCEKNGCLHIRQDFLTFSEIDAYKLDRPRNLSKMDVYYRYRTREYIILYFHQLEHHLSTFNRPGGMGERHPPPGGRGRLQGMTGPAVTSFYGKYKNIEMHKY